MVMRLGGEDVPSSRKWGQRLGVLAKAGQFYRGLGPTQMPRAFPSGNARATPALPPKRLVKGDSSCGVVLCGKFWVARAKQSNKAGLAATLSHFSLTASAGCSRPSFERGQKKSALG